MEVIDEDREVRICLMGRQQYLWCREGVYTAEIGTVTSIGSLREWTKCPHLRPQPCFLQQQRMTEAQLTALGTVYPSGTFYVNRLHPQYILQIAFLSVASYRRDEGGFYGVFTGVGVTLAHFLHHTIETCTISLAELEEDWIRKENP